MYVVIICIPCCSCCACTRIDGVTRLWAGGPVCLGVKPHLGPKTRFLLLSDSCGICWCGASSLTRGRVSHLILLLVLASAVILRSESRGTHDHILLSQIRDSANLEGQLPVFISPRNRVAQLYPQALGSLFVAFYDSQSYGGTMFLRNVCKYLLNHTAWHPRNVKGKVVPVLNEISTTPWRRLGEWMYRSTFSWPRH
jgi:hypothetical protein